MTNQYADQRGHDVTWMTAAERNELDAAQRQLDQAVKAAGERKPRLHWDEPSGASSPRGWLHVDGIVTGFYLDYGPDHYRSPHQYCRPDHLCPDCQPGNVLAVRYPNGPSEAPRESRYAETIAAARAYVETGRTS